MQEETLNQEVQYEEPCSTLDPKTFTTEQVIFKVVTFIGNLSTYVAENLPWVLELRERFEYRQGSRGIKLSIEGVMMYWDEFLDRYMGSTTENFKKVLQRLHKKESGDSAPSEPKPDEEKPLFKKGFLAGQEHAVASGLVKEKLLDALAAEEEVPEEYDEAQHIPDEPDEDIVEELEPKVPELRQGDVVSIEGTLYSLAHTSKGWKLSKVKEATA